MANLFVRFMDMGMGDCIVAKLPGGEVLMVDCGSRRDIPDYDQMWANMSGLVGSRIDALVLTHPDTDHYNRLGHILPDTVSIKALYHSGLRTTYFDLGNKIANNWWGLNDARVFAVTLNASGCTVGTTSVAKKPANSAVGLRERDSRGFLKILQSATNPPCNVWILAASVSANSADEAELRNAGSIVTLIEYGTTRLLLTGDSRIETERFLSAARPSLAGLTLAQLPHHGSAVDTFSRNFIRHLSPKIAVASVIAKNSYEVPNKPLLQYYEGFAAALGNNATNTLRCWGEARQQIETKRKRDGSTSTTVHSIWDVITLTTPKKLWSTDGHYVEFEFDATGTEVS